MSDVNIVAVLTARTGREPERPPRRPERSRRLVFVERPASLDVRYRQTDDIRGLRDDGRDAVERVDFIILDHRPSGPTTLRPLGDEQWASTHEGGLNDQ